MGRSRTATKRERGPRACGARARWMTSRQSRKARRTVPEGRTVCHTPSFPVLPTPSAVACAVFLSYNSSAVAHAGIGKKRPQATSASSVARQTTRHATAKMTRTRRRATSVASQATSRDGVTWSCASAALSPVTRSKTVLAAQGAAGGGRWHLWCVCAAAATTTSSYSAVPACSDTTATCSAMCAGRGATLTALHARTECRKSHVTTARVAGTLHRPAAHLCLLRTLTSVLSSMGAGERHRVTASCAGSPATRLETAPTGARTHVSASCAARQATSPATVPPSSLGGSLGEVMSDKLRRVPASRGLHTRAAAGHNLPALTTTILLEGRVGMGAGAAEAAEAATVVGVAQAAEVAGGAPVAGEGAAAEEEAATEEAAVEEEKVVVVTVSSAAQNASEATQMPAEMCTGTARKRGTGAIQAATRPVGITCPCAQAIRQRGGPRPAAKKAAEKLTAAKKAPARASEMVPEKSQRRGEIKKQVEWVR